MDRVVSPGSSLSPSSLTSDLLGIGSRRQERFGFCRVGEAQGEEATAGIGFGVYRGRVVTGGAVHGDDFAGQGE